MLLDTNEDSASRSLHGGPERAVGDSPAQVPTILLSFPLWDVIDAMVVASIAW